MSGAVKMNRRLYLVEDKSRVVEEGDPDARWLLCPAGGEVSHADAMRYGLLDAPATEPAAESDDSGEQQKTRTPAANKARARGADK